MKALREGEVAMTRLLRIFALLMAASMLFWLIGCGGDDDEEEDKGPAPSVASVSVASGQEVSSNATITVSFSKKMNAASVSITLNGAPAAATADATGKMFTFTPGAALEGQSVTLAIQGEDDFKQALDPAYVPITFTVKAEDKVAPTISDSGCVPPNKATGVDPAGITEMVIKFSEAMGAVTVTAKDPDFKSVDELTGDTLKVTFLQFSLSNETTYKLTLSGTDTAGNALSTTEYSFTTMAKE
jgi:cytoskeletal protein RodZ